MTTPRRSLRSRAGTPLPAVSTRASNAYGAQGKASLHTQVTTTATDFDKAFENAIPRPSVPTQGSRRPSRKASTLASNGLDNAIEPIESENITITGPTVATHFHERDSSEERPGTAIQTSAIYGADSLPQIPRTLSPEQKDEGSNVYEPGRLQLFFRTLPRYFPRLFQDASTNSDNLSFASLFRILFLLGASALLYGLFSYTSLPEHLTTGRDALVRGTNSALRFSYLPDRIWPSGLRSPNMTVEQHQTNINLLSRIQKLEARLIELGDQVKLHHEALDTLQKIMPSSVALRKVDGKWKIESHFWDALADRLSQGESAPLWRAFLSANEEKLAALSSGTDREASDRTTEDGHVLSGASFSRVIDENFQWLRTQYQEDFKEMQKSHLDFMQTIANQTAWDVFNRMPLNSYAKSQLETLVKANQIHSAYEALRTPNFFSVGMGARIDRHLTSPTMQRVPKRVIPWLWTKLSPVQYDKHPPIAALQRWDEATDCWCSSPSKDEMGRAQLTVTMPLKVYPDILVVEHVPASNTLEISAAPRELEVWAELESPDHVARMVGAMNEQVPLYRERASKCGKPPTSNFVCIGKAMYDIHSHKYVQSFPLWPDSQHLNLLTDKITVRVTENWGNDWTCIYRLRLTGTRSHQEASGAATPPGTR